jgi:protein disulfide-isomerase
MPPSECFSVPIQVSGFIPQVLFFPKFLVAQVVAKALTGACMNSPRSLLLPLLAVALICPAFAGGWSDDYKASLATAAKENKKVLLDFTGSDWCGWCIRLKRETFDQPAFKEYADKNLVLVEIDFPQGKSQSPEVKKQNDLLQQQYHVDGFPTLVLLSPEGKVIKQQSGYIPGGPKGFIEWLNTK